MCVCVDRSNPLMWPSVTDVDSSSLKSITERLKLGGGRANLAKILPVTGGLDSREE